MTGGHEARSHASSPLEGPSGRAEGQNPARGRAACKAMRPARRSSISRDLNAIVIASAAEGPLKVRDWEYRRHSRTASSPSARIRGDMSNPAATIQATLDRRKFRDPDWTAKGERRAAVALKALTTLWFNTGTLCNLTCRNCYLESADVVPFLDEIAARALPTQEIAFTGGEPFMNPHFIAILEETMARGFRALVLTNAMKPMMRRATALLALRARFGARLIIRVSLDHYTEALHCLERGRQSWKPAIAGLRWLAENGFVVRVAGRTCWGEAEPVLRQGYARLFRELGLPIDADDPAALMLFPEMDATLDVPEITEACWGILHVDPSSVMCASSRMVVKRKGEARAVVMPCTLIPYDNRFVMGRSLAEAEGAVKLNHPHCARFCVLGGGSCSRGD